MEYKSLNPGKIQETVALLNQRIKERFPESGLGRVCSELHTIASKTRERSTWISRPIYSLRIATYLLVAVVLAGMASIFNSLQKPAHALDFFQFVQLLEAGINDLVLIGAAIFFLVTLETRIKRRRALKAVHELRAIAHIIDMHQLTKDPEALLFSGSSTSSSPKREMNSFELSRYLDYCNEMLSLAGKVGALYIQDFDDPVVIASVNEVEDLTTGLSRKIWQKLMILNSSR